MALQFLFWEPPSCKLLFHILVGLDWKYLVVFFLAWESPFCFKNIQLQWTGWGSCHTMFLSHHNTAFHVSLYQMTGSERKMTFLILRFCWYRFTFPSKRRYWATSSYSVDWTHEFVFPSKQAVQMKQDLLVQSGSISNKDCIFQCSLCCFDCRNKDKQFLITNNSLHALLTDNFVQIVGACSF